MYMYMGVYFVTELIRQQKEKLSSLQTSSERDDEEGEEEESLMSGNHQLLRKLVMSSITQLAEIAYDIGSLDDIELDLDEIDEDDKEVGASSLKRDDSGDEGGEKWSTHGEGVSAGTGDKGQGADDRESSQGDQKVSDKMKKMADSVKNTGRDDALESLLANLAVTAQYIESLENTESDAEPSAQDNTVPKEATDQFETGEPGHRGQEKHKHTSTASDISVRGPPPADSRNSGRTSSSGESEPSEDHGEYHSTSGSISEEILAASDAELEEEEEILEEFGSELVREMEHHLEETLAKQLNTNGQYTQTNTSVRLYESIWHVLLLGRCHSEDCHFTTERGRGGRGRGRGRCQ